MAVQEQVVFSGLFDCESTFEKILCVYYDFLITGVHKTVMNFFGQVLRVVRFK